MEESQKSQNLSHRQWVDLLLSYFTTIKEFEEKIEPLRQSLYQQNDFTPKSLFNHLDNNSKNFISLDDFIKFLQDNSINYDEKYLRQFIHNYDKDNDFCINYQEFNGIITPLTDDSYKQRLEEIENEEKNKEKKEKNEKGEKKEEDGKENNIDNKEENNNDNKDENNIENKEDNNNIENKEDNDNIENKEENKDEKKDENKEEKKEENNIDPEILKIFGQILTEEMSLTEKISDIAKQCMGSKFFTFYESFREIADDEKYITEENLSNFLKKNGIELNEKEPKGLIHRNDTDNDGKISFSEYKQIFYPLNDVQHKRSLNDYNKYLDEYNSILKSGNNYKSNNSSYYPNRNNNLQKGNYYNNYNYNKSYYIPNDYKTDYSYQSPKLKHTSSPLNYDYSTFADEDTGRYSRNKRNRNSSVANLKNYPRTLYNNNNDCDSYYRRCCGCPLTNFIIHTPGCCCCFCYEI